MFFPSLPSMGVMLFPSSVLGNAPGENGASLALLSLFLFFFFLLFSFLLPFHVSFSLNSFHPFSSSLLFHFFIFCLLFIMSFSFVLFCFLLLLFPFSGLLPFISISFSFLFPRFFFGGTACTECFSRCDRGHH